MRLRLAHTQALLLLATVLVSVLSMGALNAWNLRNGFSDFLASRDVERLEAFARLVSERAGQAQGLERLLNSGENLHTLLGDFRRTQDGLAFAPPHPQPPPDPFGRPPPPPPMLDRVDAFKDRVALYGPKGEPLSPPVPGAEGDAVVVRAILVQGREVGTVRMRKLKPVPDDVETRFLSSQYQSIFAVAVALLLAALFGARKIAGHWVRPLLAMQAVTGQIAQGQFETRLPEGRSDEIGDAMRNINHMAEGLQKLEASRRRWIADISHELRTPLTVLRGEVEALLDGVRPLTPDAMASLREEVLQLGRLVDDLHLLAMADLRALPCWFEDLDARDLVQTVVQRFAPAARRQGLELVLQHSAEAALPVRWDGRRIEQLLGNLLDNSLRYTDAPGQVHVRLHAKADRVAITVEDSAPGVSPADLPKIFEPLYRADAARSRVAIGSGLGLAICTQIAKAHGGTIVAQTSPLGGLALTLELPCTGDTPV